MPKPPFADRGLMMKTLMGTPRHALGETPADAFADWQARARAVLAEKLGPVPDPVPVDAGWDEGVVHVADDELHGIKLKRLHVRTFGEVEAMAWLAIPEGHTAENPGPAVLVQPGHVLHEHPYRMFDAASHPQPPEAEGYHGNFDLAMFRAGYAILVVEPLGFNQRRDPDAVAGGPAGDVTVGCKVVADMASAYGMSLAGLRAHESRRLLGVLADTPGVDPTRLAMAGISGGGTTTLHVAALEDRLAAVIISGYINTFADSVFAMPHCVCNVVPGLSCELDIPDMAALVAPTPLLVSSGLDDPIFPAHGVNKAEPIIRRAYGMAGADDAVRFDRFDGGHVWHHGPDLAFLHETLGQTAAAPGASR